MDWGWGAGGLTSTIWGRSGPNQVTLRREGTRRGHSSRYFNAADPGVHNSVCRRYAGQTPAGVRRRRIRGQPRPLNEGARDQRERGLRFSGWKSLRIPFPPDYQIEHQIEE